MIQYSIPHRRLSRLVLLATVLLLALPLGCSSHAPSPAPVADKVVIIALDGVSWHNAAPLMESGRMPYLARMAGNGCRASLGTLKPTWTPIIFTTMATGKLPEAHGVKHFVDENGTPLSSNMRRVKALWNIAGDAGRKVVFVGWPVTWPAEEVNGVLVTDNYGMRQQHQIHPQAMAPELARRLARLEKTEPGPEARRLLKVSRQAIRGLGGKELKGGKPGPAEDGEAKAGRRNKTTKSLKGLHMNQVMDHIRPKLLREQEVSAPYFIELVAREQPDLAAVYFSGTDLLQHMCGARENHSGKPGVTSRPNMLAAVEEAHTFYDRIVGQLMEGITAIPGFEACTFIVVSDHGFDLDITDETFALRYREPGACPLPEHLATPSLFASIKPGTGDDLGWWVCRFAPGLELPARRQYLNQLIHHGQGGLESKRVITTIVHDYQPPGILIIQGGPVASAGSLGNVAMDQVAPTVLALLGLPVAEDMAGGPVPLPLTGPDGRPTRLEAPAMVPTYDTEPRTMDSGALSSESDEKIRQQLRLMGYIE